MKKILTLLLVLAVMLSAFGCSGGGGPKGVVEDFFKYFEAGDADKLNEIVKDFYYDSFKSFMEDPVEKATLKFVSGNMEHKVLDETISENTATVKLEITVPTNDTIDEVSKFLYEKNVDPSLDYEKQVEFLVNALKEFDKSKIETTKTEGELKLEKVEDKWMILNDSLGEIFNGI